MNESQIPMSSRNIKQGDNVHSPPTNSSLQEPNTSPSSPTKLSETPSSPTSPTPTSSRHLTPSNSSDTKDDKNEEKEHSPAKLFIGQIPRHVSENELRKYFEPYGKIRELTILRDRKTNQHRGCAFLTYTTRSAAEAAIRNVDGKIFLYQRAIVVRFAGEKEQTKEWKLFVGMLSRETTEEQVMQLFSYYGGVKEVYIMREPNAQSKGCAFVKYGTREEAERAITGLHDKHQDQGAPKKLIVKFAETKQEKSQKQEQKLSLILGDQRGLGIGMTNIGGNMNNIPSMGGNLNMVGMNSMGMGNINNLNLGGLSVNPNAMNLNNMNGINNIGGLNSLPLHMATGHNLHHMNNLGAINNNLGLNNLNPMGNINNIGLNNIGVLNSPLNSNMNNLNNMSNITPINNVGGNGGSMNSNLMSLGINATGTTTANNTNPSTPLNPNATYYPHVSDFPPPSQQSSAQLHQSPQSTSRTNEARGPEGANLFIHGVPSAFSDDDLGSMFSNFGTVLSAKVFKDKATGIPRGFGFVSYNDPLAADRAIASLNGFMIGTKRLKVMKKTTGSVSGSNRHSPY